MAIRRVPTTAHYGKPSAQTMWQAREDFTTSGSMRGEWHRAGMWGEEMGRLNPEERNAVSAFMDGARANDRASVFVVYSYATPIAFSYDDVNGKRIDYHVKQRFSVTTSKHQGRLYLIGE